MRHLINLRSLIKCTSTCKQSLIWDYAASRRPTMQHWCGVGGRPWSRLAWAEEAALVESSTAGAIAGPSAAAVPPQPCSPSQLAENLFFLVLKYCHFEFWSQVMSVGPMFAFLPQNIVQLDKLLSRLVCTGLLSNTGILWLELDVLPDQSVTNIQIYSDINKIFISSMLSG